MRQRARAVGFPAIDTFVLARTASPSRFAASEKVEILPHVDFHNYQCSVEAPNGMLVRPVEDIRPATERDVARAADQRQMQRPLGLGRTDESDDRLEKMREAASGSAGSAAETVCPVREDRVIVRHYADDPRLHRPMQPDSGCIPSGIVPELCQNPTGKWTN